MDFPPGASSARDAVFFYSFVPPLLQPMLSSATVTPNVMSKS